MKNLRLLCHQWHKYVDVRSVQIIAPPCDNADEIIISDNLKIFQINTVTRKLNLILDLQEIIPLPGLRIVNFAYFSVERILVCAVNTGEIVRLDVDSLQADVANVFGEGIKAMQVSPDNEQLVFVTDSNTLNLTDCRLDIINSVSLTDEHFGDGEFMTVGWGKKETQFHGKEGKEAAKKKTVIEECGGNVEGGNVLITWRGDGTLFAVGFYLNSVYTFKVFDREAVLKFTSESQPGIECNFVWRPSGNLIATTQQFPNKYVVAFFEKNGLKHGEFILPFKKTDVSVKKLSWSCDSDILCVWCVESLSLKSFILIYTVNNYHWYLKQCINFTCDSGISAMAWDESNTVGNGKLLHMFLNGGIYTHYNWVWSVDASRGKTEKDDALVGVVDGKNVLLTSFRKAVVPPPMAAFTLKCSHNINVILFGPTLINEDALSKNVETNNVIVLMEDGTLSIYKTNVASGFELELYGSVSLKQITNLNTPMALSQLLWLTKDTILCICSNGSLSDLLVVKLSFIKELVLDVNTIPINYQTIGMTPIPYSEKAILQTLSGKLMVYSALGGLKDYDFSFPECCYQFEACCLPGNESTILLFGLTHRHRFFINEKEVANNVSSFFVHSDFLLLTTLQHQLLCCPLSKDIMNIIHVGTILDDKNASNATVSQRKLERGSKLVTAVSCDTRTILQLPRGNIEAIQPRALSLKLIGNFLDNCQYLKAFDLMRKQRINLNLIYDHDPEKFIAHIDDFISEINNPSWLSLFISELDDQSVIETMYSSSYTHNIGIGRINEKVKTVCQMMREGLNKNNNLNKNLLPILTTYVKTNSVSDLETSLLLIKSIKVECETDSEKNVVSADEALKYLLYLVNVNHLYDIALGIYDFDLVMFVASKSQKDPKEYVPYLNELRTMDENYKRFSVDNFLKRYESALKNLVACGSEREVELMSYIKQHNLYKSALRYIPREDSRYQSCAEEFGDYLTRRKNYSEAGIMYKRSKNLSKALDSFIEAIDWQASMCLADDLQMSDTARIEIKEKLLVKLKDAKKFSEALDMLLYSRNVTADDLVSCSLEGRLYKKTLSICKQFKRSDLIESKLQHAVMEQYSSLISTVSQKRELFLKQKARLLLVRQTKIDVQENGEDFNEDCDLFSDTSSIAYSNTTRTSGRSFRSSKNRRKHERKLMSLKEGSRFEDVALVRALHVLVTNTFGLRQDMADIIFVLQWLDKDEEVLQLQNCLESLLKDMTKSFSEIWTPELLNDTNKSNTDTNAESNHQLDATSTLEPHIRIAPVIQDMNWKLETL